MSARRNGRRADRWWRGVTRRAGLTGWVLGLALGLVACGAPPLSAERFQAHVDWLADDARGGRGTGTEGMAASAAYVAAAFDDLGLEPVGDGGTFLQAFQVPGERALVEGSALTLAGQDLELGRDWQPFLSAVDGSLDGELVFVGFGIQDLEGEGASGWDDYAGVELEGRVALVLRGAPGGAEGPFGSGPGQVHAQLRSKINRAYRAGAGGVLIVNTHPAAGAEDTVLDYGAFDASGQIASLPAAHLTHAAASAALGGTGFELAAAEQAAARGPVSRPVAGVSAALTIASERLQLDSVNVLGLLPGSDPDRADEWLMVGAHLDHLGLGGDGSRGGAESYGQIHNGADDNASGVAGLLGVAAALAERDLPRTVVFAAFGAEERGLLGSLHLAEHPPRPLEQLVTMVNMDMIGRAVEGRVEVGGLGTATIFDRLLADAMALQPWPVVREGLPSSDDEAGASDLDDVLHAGVGTDADAGATDAGAESEADADAGATDAGAESEADGDADTGTDTTAVDDDSDAVPPRLILACSAGVTANSDHASFFDRGVPTLSFFTGLHDDYHMPSDDAPLIDAEAGAAIASLAASFTEVVAREIVRPAFQDPATHRPSVDGAAVQPFKGREVRRYSVSFGSRPDMGYAGDDGVRISGVRAGSPAEACGLQRGDVIVAMDGTAIRNLSDYSVLLFSHLPGEEMVVTVRRDGALVDLTAVLDPPSGAQ